MRTTIPVQRVWPGIRLPLRPPAPRPLSLRLNFSWTLVGNLVASGSQWATLSVLAKFGSPRMVGQYALGVAVSQTVTMFAQLNLRIVQATDTGQRYDFGDYLGLRLITTALGIFTIAALALSGGNHRETVGVILLVGVGSAFDSVSDIFYGLLHLHERMDRIAIGMSARGLLALAGAWLGTLLAGSVLAAVAGVALASLAVMIFYDIPQGLRILRIIPPSGVESSDSRTGASTWQSNFDPMTLVLLARHALPMGITMLLVALTSNIPRYFIKHYRGEHELGLFAAMAIFIGLGRTVMNALGQAACPRLAKLFATGQRGAFRALMVRLVALGIIGGTVGPLVAAVAGRPILRLIYTVEYEKQVGVLVLVLIAGGIGYVNSFLGYGITAAMYYRIQIAWIGLTATVATLAGWWMIPSGGLSGAALSMVLAMGIQLACGLAILVAVLRAPSTVEDPCPGREPAA